jgi:hypothetical protein
MEDRAAMRTEALTEADATGEYTEIGAHTVGTNVVPFVSKEESVYVAKS